MKAKRIVSTVVALSLVLSISFTTAYADGWGKNKNKNKIPPGQAKKYFDDLDSFKWAEQAIEKMFLKGLINGMGNGRYVPQSAVTKLEAIVMSLRVMGWEDEAIAINDLPKKYRGDVVANWAKGYVTIAYEKGILDDVDMMYFKPQEPAKRHEVAKYVVRALGYDDEARDNMDKKLPFVDAPAVPQGSVGYVYMINDLGLMEGSAKKFNPMGTMTRAEMAVLFSRLDDKVDSDDDERVAGEVYKVYEDRIAVKVNGTTKNYDVDDKVRVYDGKDRVDYDDIKTGDKVKMELKDGEVVYIEIVDKLDEDKIIARYKGTVKEIDTTKPYRIALQSETMLMMFEVVDNVEVEFKNGEGKFSEIEEDDKIGVVVDRRNRVTQIFVERNREREDWDDEVEGTITAIDLAGSYHLTIDKEEYDLDEDAEVKIDGRNKDLEDLRVGMYAEVKLENDEIISIDAESVEDKFYGEIRGIDDEIEIKKDNGKYVTYDVSDDVDIEIEGVTRPDIDDLEIGDYAKFEIKNDIIISIEVQNKITEEEGILLSIDKDTITVKVDKKEKEYDLANVVKVEVKDHRNYIDYLEIGMKVELEIKNDEVISIYAEDNEFEIEGEIKAITVSSKGTTLKIETDDDKEVSYLVSEDAEIEIEDIENANVDDLEVGQEGEFEVINNTIVEISIED
jgi:S-layer family protein